MKKNIKLVIGFILVIIVCTTTVYAVNTIINANEVGYIDNTNIEAVNVQDAIDKLYKKATVIKQGDYIRLTPTSTSYIIPASETGYESDQTINPSELTLWRVISVTTNGIEVVSDQVSSTRVYFGTNQNTKSTITGNEPSVVAYRKYIKILNTIATQYTDEVHVKGTRHMGYDSSVSTPEITSTTSLIATEAPWNVSNAIGEESKGGGDLGYLVDYNKVINVYGTAIANKVGTEVKTSYWLASRCYYYYGFTDWHFYVRLVTPNGNVDKGIIYYLNSAGFMFNCNSNFIRPILTLKSDVVVSGGSGTKSDPYILA